MARRRPLLFCSLFIAACTGPASLPPITVGADVEAMAALEAETGHPWTMRRHASLRTPALLDGRTRPLAVTPRDADRAARDFLARHRALYRMSSPEEELASTGSETDELGMTHARFRQRLNRLPVWGGDLLVHFDTDGALVRINGRYGPVRAPASTSPRVLPDEARVIAATRARTARPEANPNAVTTQDAELMLYPLDGADPDQPRETRLCWDVVAEVRDHDRPLVLEVLVDADDGKVLTSFDRVQELLGSGVGVLGDRKPINVEKKKTAYWLEDRTRGETTPSRTYSASGHTRLPGSELRSDDPDRWDALDSSAAGAAVDAHAYVAKTWDYFQSQHGRSGFADDGKGVRATVHFGDRYANAFFDGEQLVFGDGDDKMTAPSAALDVVAHEYTHGVVAATAGLHPYGESGAMNEGLADLFGCLVAWTSGRGGRWQIGETIFHPKGGRNRPLRDLANPHESGQPATLAELDPATLGDGGDVHVGASIVGHLGYLLVEGDGGAVRSLGAAPVGRLFYRAMTRYLFPRAGFAELADAVAASAHDLGGGIEPDVDAALMIMGLR